MLCVFPTHVSGALQKKDGHASSPASHAFSKPLAMRKGWMPFSMRSRDCADNRRGGWVVKRGFIGVPKVSMDGFQSSWCFGSLFLVSVRNP